jgi:phage-related protein
MPGVMSLASAVGGLLSAAFGALQSVAVSVFNAIQPYIPAVQAAIGSLASAIGGTLNTAFQAAANFVTGTVVPALTNLGQWLADNLPGAIQALANFWTGTLQPAIASVAGWITGTLFPALGELFGWLQAQLPGALQALANFWTGTLQPAIVQVAGWITGTLFPMFGELVNWLSSTLTGALQTLSDFWGQHGDTILTTAQNTWEAIQSVIDAVFGTITGLWQAFQSAREGDWTGFGEKLRAIWDASWEAIKNVILSAWPVIVQTAANIVTGIQETFTSIDWGAVGTAVVQGIADGISAGIDFITDAARNVAEAALNAAKAFLGIASPSAVMADEVGRPMAEGIAEGFLEALQGGGLAQIVGGVRGVLAELATVLKGIGGVFSNSDLEKFRDGIGALADALASIAGISGIFGGETMPSLTGLVDLIRQLAIDARAVLAELDIVVPVIGETLAARLKALGEAASGAKSVAENAFGLIKLLAETLAFDFGGVDWSTAYHNLIGLARAALIYVQALDPVTLVVSDELIAKLRSLGDGVGAVKAIAENTFGLIKVLVDTLAFDFAAPDWSRAWHNLMGLMQAAITYADAALRLADTFTGVVSGAATELGKALQLTVGIIQNAFDMLTFLEDVEVPLTPFLYLLVKLGQVIPLASRVSEAFLLIASQFTGIVTVAATELGKALALAVGTIRDWSDGRRENVD